MLVRPERARHRAAPSAGLGGCTTHLVRPLFFSTPPARTRTIDQPNRPRAPFDTQLSWLSIPRADRAGKTIYVSRHLLLPQLTWPPPPVVGGLAGASHRGRYPRR